MDTFATQTFHDAYIKLAIYVGPNAGDRVHKNRPFHGLAYICDGIKDYCFEDKQTITVRQNDIIYLPKNSNYVVDSIESGGVYAINFDTAQNMNIPEFMCSTKNASELLKSFQTAEKFWTSKAPGYYERCASELYNILYHLKKVKSAKYLPNTKVAILKPALEYINTYYPYETISIPHLANLCGIGEVYFRKIFKHAYGVSPLKYINHLKLARARELIISGEYSVRDAAFLSGFFDDSYFSREFKKEFGQCPKSLTANNSLHI